MSTACPHCKREFEDSAGFCPFDGAPLVVASPGAPAHAHDGPNADGAGETISLMNAPSTTAAMRALGIEATHNPYNALVDTTLDGRYVIKRLLGEGSTGVVFLAYHTLIEKPVAIKVLRAEAAADPNLVRRFVQEAQAASRIGNPKIVDITDFGTTAEGWTYSVMEYIEGPTLDQVITECAPMAPARAMSIAAQIAYALAAAHEKGIVHRDLKPENVFVLSRDNGRESVTRATAAQETVKIVDFGIAKVIPLHGDQTGPRLTAMGMVFGTPEYMAPEQAAGLPDVDHRVDIYSLGVILYQMLSGRVPHQGGEMMRTLAMKMLDPVTPLREARPDLDISPGLDQLVLHALARKPEQRLQTMAEFQDALRARMDMGKDMSMGTGADAVAMTPSARAPMAVPASPSGEIPGELTDSLIDGMPTMLYVDSAKLSAAIPAPERTAGVREHTRHPLIWLAIVLALVSSGVVGYALIDRGRDQRASASAGEAAAGSPEHIAPEHTATGTTAGTVTSTTVGNDGTLANVADTHATHRIDVANDDQGDRPDAAVEHPGDKRDPGAHGRRTASTKPHDTPTTTKTGTKTDTKTGTETDTGARDSSDGEPDHVVAKQSPKKRRIKVLTQPEHASLYVNHDYSGRGGTTIERDEGTRLTVQCRLEGYENGTVTIHFDGETDVYLCPLKHSDKCLDGIKNPFDDCP